MEAILQFCISCSKDKDSFASFLIKHELSCSLDLGGKSFWKWICDSTFQIIRAEQPLSESLTKKIVILTKLVLVTSSKDSANLD